MDSFYDILEELWAIITLVIPALKSLAASKPSDFWYWISVSILFAISMYFIMLGVGRLVFKKYRLTFFQHIAWIFNSILSGAAITFWVVGQNLAPGLNLLLLFWQGNIQMDQSWAEKNHAVCYKAVNDLGIEDFSGHSSGDTIPLSSPESRMVFTRVMMDGAAMHFATQFPPLGRLLNVTEGLDTPSSELKEKVDEFFEQAEPEADGKKSLPRIKSIDMCSEILRKTFHSRVDSLETLVIVISIIVPTMAWLLLLAWILCSSRKKISDLIVTVSPI